MTGFIPIDILWWLGLYFCGEAIKNNLIPHSIRIGEGKWSLKHGHWIVRPATHEDVWLNAYEEPPVFKPLIAILYRRRIGHG